MPDDELVIEQDFEGDNIELDQDFNVLKVARAGW